MQIVGSIETIWRYPVKSMAGESVTDAFLGFAGVYGDRCYAFRNSAARKGFPYLNAVAQQQMLKFRPKFRDAERAAKPPNWEAAKSIAPGVNPADADPGDLLLDVETPSGEVVAIDDPALIEMLKEGLRGVNDVTLVHSARALADCRPLSMISWQTVRQIDQEFGSPVDARRFRANIYLNMSSGEGFAEDELVGRRVRIGSTAEILVLERDPRCKMISLDPETGEHDPAVLRHVAHKHQAYSGVYCAVLVEGVFSKGDAIALLD